MSSQDKDFDYFITHHDEIFAEYPDSFVVISNKEVKKSAKTFEEALTLALEEGMNPGSFIIQECTQGNKSFTQRFRSRVVFKP